MKSTKNRILSLFRSKNTIFTFKDVALLWGETDIYNLKAALHYYVKRGLLYAVRKGIYAKDNNYNQLELATKIYTPSYISLETVLAKEGIIFQHYDAIFAVSYLSRQIRCNGQTFIFKKIKNITLMNQLGLEEKENYYVATKERAFLDAIYLYKNYHFDNLSSLDWNKCRQLLHIYKSKILAKK